MLRILESLIFMLVFVFNKFSVQTISGSLPGSLFDELDLVTDRGTEVDVNEAMKDYEEWVTVKTDSAASKKEEEKPTKPQAPLTAEQDKLTPRSAKRKRDLEWEEIWRMERILNLSADSRLSLVTETDIDSDCESEPECPQDFPR